mgnify:FL=1
MPVVATHLMDGGSNSAPSLTYTTASVSVPAGYLMLFSVSSDTNAVLPTISGLGVTWTQVASGSGGTNNWDVTTFRALSLSPLSGTITITFSSTTSLDDVAWILDTFQNVDQSGTGGANAIVQTATNSGAGVTSLTVTLAAFSSADNATFGAMVVNGTNNITPGSGFTELNENDASSRTTQTQFKNTNDTGVDWSWSGNQSVGGLAIELKYSAVDLTKIGGSPMFFDSVAIG